MAKNVVLSLNPFDVLTCDMAQFCGILGSPNGYNLFYNMANKIPNSFFTNYRDADVETQTRVAEQLGFYNLVWWWNQINQPNSNMILNDVYYDNHKLTDSLCEKAFNSFMKGLRAGVIRNLFSYGEIPFPIRYSEDMPETFPAAEPQTDSIINPLYSRRGKFIWPVLLEINHNIEKEVPDGQTYALKGDYADFGIGYPNPWNNWYFRAAYNKNYLFYCTNYMNTFPQYDLFPDRYSLTYKESYARQFLIHMYESIMPEYVRSGMVPARKYFCNNINELLYVDDYMWIPNMYEWGIGNNGQGWAGSKEIENSHIYMLFNGTYSQYTSYTFCDAEGYSSGRSFMTRTTRWESSRTSGPYFFYKYNGSPAWTYGGVNQSICLFPMFRLGCK